MAPGTWTGRKIALLWSLAILLLVMAWGVAHFTAVLPSGLWTFVVLWSLVSVGPAVATWRWVRSGPAIDEYRADEKAADDSSEEPR